MWQTRLLKSRLFLGGLLLLLAALAANEYKQYRQRLAIEKEIQSIIAQGEALQAKNRQLSDSLNYLNTDSYKERLAREQLNLKKPGEIVVNFANLKAQPQNAEAQAQNSPKQNAVKWWNYFFGTRDNYRP